MVFELASNIDEWVLTSWTELTLQKSELETMSNKHILVGGWKKKFLFLCSVLYAIQAYNKIYLFIFCMKTQKELVYKHIFYTTVWNVV